MILIHVFKNFTSNLGGYFSGSFSDGGKITPSKTCSGIAKSLKTDTKVTENKHTSGPL